MADWPMRPRHRHRGERVARVGSSAIKHMPVTASAPRPLPQPSLAPRDRSQALAAAIILIATLLMLLALISFSVVRFELVGLTGKFFVGTIIVLTLIATLLFVVGLGLYVLPVLFGVRKPAMEPPPTWPGVGDKH